MDKKAILEALKEIGRLVVLSMVSYLLTVPTKAFFNALGFYVTPEQDVVFGGLYLAVLRAVDKYGHVLEPEGKAGGLVRF
jgi:hypothetical protein